MMWAIASALNPLLATVLLLSTQTQACYCDCHYNNCPSGQQCQPNGLGVGFCIPRNSDVKPIFCPVPWEPESTDGPCDGFCVSDLEGSACGEFPPEVVAKVLMAWGKGYDVAGQSGGGPIGERAHSACRLGHKLLGARGSACREILARTSLDLQQMCCGTSFLDHSASEENMFHRAEDHSVADISGNLCRQKVGELCVEALVEELTVSLRSSSLHDPQARIREKLNSTITKFCGREELQLGKCRFGRQDDRTDAGDGNIIGCMADEIYSKAVWLATPPVSRSDPCCGDENLDVGEECEKGISCKFPTQLCVACTCVDLDCI